MEEDDEVEDEEELDMKSSVKIVNKLKMNF